MQRAVLSDELKKVQDRIRTRLWIQRVSDITRDTTDETIFETQVRSFANDALRRRMETEMADAKVKMERQIHAFQGEVDRRMEEQAMRVHALVEERVQRQLDTILAIEMEKVRAMVEESVQERVRAVVQRDVRATFCEVQVRLSALARENDRLRTALVEHSDICFRSLVLALNPRATGLFGRTLRLIWCCRRRLTSFSAWLIGVPADREERVRARMEALRRASGSDANVLNHLRVLWGPDAEETRRLFLPTRDNSEGLEELREGDELPTSDGGTGGSAEEGRLHGRPGSEDQDADGQNVGPHDDDEENDNSPPRLTELSTEEEDDDDEDEEMDDGRTDDVDSEIELHSDLSAFEEFVDSEGAADVGNSEATFHEVHGADWELAEFLDVEVESLICDAVCSEPEREGKCLDEWREVSLDEEGARSVLTSSSTADDVHAS